jgi:hypothetical protein
MSIIHLMGGAAFFYCAEYYNKIQGYSTVYDELRKLPSRIRDIKGRYMFYYYSCVGLRHKYERTPYSTEQ